MKQTVRTILAPLVMLLLLTMTAPLQARPEKPKPGIVYYSDEMDEESEIPDLLGEKNLEEVYRNYVYYEAVYDEQGRVVIFREFKREALNWEEKFEWSADGKLLKRNKIKH